MPTQMYHTQWDLMLIIVNWFLIETVDFRNFNQPSCISWCFWNKNCNYRTRNNKFANFFLTSYFRYLLLWFQVHRIQLLNWSFIRTEQFTRTRIMNTCWITKFSLLYLTAAEGLQNSGLTFIIPNTFHFQWQAWFIEGYSWNQSFPPGIAWWRLGHGSSSWMGSRLSVH